MCDASTYMKSRRAQLEEVLTVTRKHGVVVVAPDTTDVECACLKTGDRVQFCTLPQTFQDTHAVGPNAVAVFKESSHNGSTRAQEDRFDFENGSVVSMSNLPQGIRLNCTQIDGRRAKRHSSRTLQVPRPEGEGVLVGVGGNGTGGVHAGVLRTTVGRVGAVIGSMSILTICIAIFR